MVNIKQKMRMMVDPIAYEKYFLVKLNVIL